jgi:tRNA pseudouridine55 synthase
VVALTRRAVGTRRVGHAGTLDPFATGLLVVLVGSATRLARYLVGLPKVYAGVVRLGTTTATDDATGAVLATSDGCDTVSEAAIASAMMALTGERDQVPPAFSAKHSGGERAHRLARRGEPVTLAPQRVTVRHFTLEARAGRDLRFRAAVGSGTYIRSLARELGEALGCGAHLSELRRLSVGPFTVEEAVSLEAVRGETPRLLPVLLAVRHLPQAVIDAAARDRVRRGQALEAAFAAGGPVALTCDGDLVAVARPRDGRWQPEVVVTP